MPRLKRLLIGAGRLFDFSGSYREADGSRAYARLKTMPKTPAEAFQQDLRAIGGDFRKVCLAYEQKAQHGK